jgi:MFS family permease
VSRLPSGAFWPLACFAALGTFWGAWAALLPDIRLQIGASDAELGLAMLGAGAGALPAMLLAGRLWRRLSWWLLPICAAAYAIATLSPLLATTPAHLALALVTVGASSGALDVAMNAAISDVEAQTRARVMYGAHALFSLAVLVAAVTTGLARDMGAGPPQVLTGVAVVLALTTAGSVVAAARRRPAAPDPPVVGEAGLRFPGRGVFAILAALCATALLIEDAVQNWGALHLERTLLTGPALGGAAPGIFAGAMFAGRSLGQVLGSRLSERALVGGGGVLAAIGLMLVAAAPVPAVALAGLATAGAGIALVAPALYARVGRLAGSRGRGAAIATLTFFAYMGFLVGPVLMGILAEAAGLRVAMAALAVLGLGLAICGAIAFRDRSHGNVIARGEELLRTSRG